MESAAALCCCSSAAEATREWYCRCQCGAATCVGFLGGHTKTFQAALAAEGPDGRIQTAALQGFDDASDGGGSGVDDLSDFASDGEEGSAGPALALVRPVQLVRPPQPDVAATAERKKGWRSPAAPAAVAAAAAAAAHLARNEHGKQRLSKGSMRPGKRKREGASAAAARPASAPGAVSSGHSAAARHHSTFQRPRLGSQPAEEIKVRRMEYQATERLAVFN